MNRIAAMLVVLLCVAGLWAQEQPKKQEIGYRIDISLVELENNKKINTRQYSVLATDGAGTSILNTNLRLPYTGEKGPQYLDIGFDFNCRLRLMQDGVLHFDGDGQLSAMSPENGATTPPPLRRNRFIANTVVIPGKPFIMASLDQLETNRRYEVVVTVSKSE